MIFSLGDVFLMIFFQTDVFMVRKPILNHDSGISSLIIYVTQVVLMNIENKVSIFFHLISTDGCSLKVQLWIYKWLPINVGFLPLTFL